MKAATFPNERRERPQRPSRAIPRAWGDLVALLLLLCPGIGSAGAKIEWTADFEGALAQATSETRFVMVDFYTSWCTWCRVLDKKTFSKDEVVAATERMICVKLNAEREVDVARRYGVQSYPTVVF